MSECFEKGHPLPSIVESSRNDDEFVFAIKRLIRRMTTFHDEDRCHISKVESVLSQIIGKHI